MSIAPIGAVADANDPYHKYGTASENPETLKTL